MVDKDFINPYEA